jgi:hypothetical protein
MDTVIFWDVMMCGLVNIYLRFGLICCLHHQIRIFPPKTSYHVCFLVINRLTSNLLFGSLRSFKLQACLKLPMKLLSYCLQFKFLGYALVYAPMYPVKMGSSSYSVVCSCTRLYCVVVSVLTAVMLFSSVREMLSASGQATAAGPVPRLGHVPFLPNPFQIVIFLSWIHTMLQYS